MRAPGDMKVRRFPQLLITLCMTALISCAPMQFTPTPNLPPAPSTVRLPIPTPVSPQPTRTGGLDDEQIRWLESAQLGPFAPEKQDWVMIEEAAKMEGRVVVYSDSSRIQNAARAFMKQYPDILVETLDRSVEDIAIRLRKEREEGDYNCDVFFAGDAARVMGELLPQHYIWPFIPEEMTNLIDPPYRSPVLVHHLQMNVIVYNFETYDAPPIDNWWDLTRSEWRGKVVMRNPLYIPTDLYPFVMMIQHSEEMAQAYQIEFGKPIELDEDCPNAGYQWIADFLANDPVFLDGASIVAEKIGAAGQADPPLGIIPYRRYQDVLNEQLFFEPILDIEPFAGCLQPTYLAIADRAPHPNAAKLMIRWLMGDPSREDMGGFKQWWNVGEWSPRVDVPMPLASYSLLDLDSKVWNLDPHFVFENARAVREFWLAHLQ